MLVLSRRMGQKIVIDGHIVVTVTAIQGDRVRLGFDAPAHVTIDREEVHNDKRRNGQRNGNGRPRMALAR